MRTRKEYLKTNFENFSSNEEYSMHGKTSVKYKFSIRIRIILINTSNKIQV